MSGVSKIRWTFVGSPDVSGNQAKNWKNELGKTITRLSVQSVPAAFLVREALQNMLDAWRNGVFREKVGEAHGAFHVTARFVTHHKRACLDVLDSLGLDEELLNEIESRVSVSGGDDADEDEWKEFVKRLKRIRRKQELTVLLLEEEGSSGMFVDAAGGRDGMLAALYSHNQGNPQKGAGGSYGHGKGALAKASRLRMNVAYTNTDWCAEPNNLNRLMGVIYMPSFRLPAPGHPEGIQRSGFGLLVETMSTSEYVNGSVPGPYNDQAADAMAKNIGIGLRGKGEHGTTMLIVDPDFGVDDFKKAVELNWLPAIIRGHLNVTIVTEDRGSEAASSSQKTADPRGNASLYGFCAAQDLLQGAAAPSSADLQSRVYEEAGIGKLAVVATLDETESGHRLVYSRSREIGLVISYRWLNIPLPQGTTVSAHFQADATIDEVLRRSEPKTHNEWDASSEQGRESQKIVQRVEAFIKESIQDFVKNLRGGAQDTTKELDVLGDIFDAFLNTDGTKQGKFPNNTPTGGSGGPKSTVEIGIYNEETNPPTLTVSVRSEVDLTLHAVLEVLDDEGRVCGHFEANTVGIRAGTKQTGRATFTLDPTNKHPFTAASDKDSDLVIDLGNAIKESYRLRWNVSYREAAE
jgi:hypothetical protein